MLKYSKKRRLLEKNKRNLIRSKGRLIAVNHVNLAHLVNLDTLKNTEEEVM